MDEDHYFLKRTHNKDPNFFSFLFLIVAEVLTNSHYNLFYCKRWGRGDDDSFDKEYIFCRLILKEKYIVFVTVNTQLKGKNVSS